MGEKSEKKFKGIGLCNDSFAFIIFLVLILLVIGFGDD